MAADSAAAASRSGVIHDLGYQRYDGPRLGRAGIIRALCWHSLRSAFGIGRGAKAKVVPILTFVIMCLPAVANAVAVAQGQPRAIPYDTYIFQLRVIVMIIFIAAQAPELVSRDLRSHVLAMIDIPVILLYLGTVTQSHGGSAIWHQTRALIPGLLVGLMWAVTLAAIGLFLASLSGRRAYSTGTIAIYFFLSWILAEILYSVSTAPGHPLRGGPVATTGARLSGLVSPFTVVDGVRQWLGGTSRGPIPPPGSYGPLYGVMLLVLLGVAVGGLALRYRKAGVA
jgi:ABC-2 type transport system permease protein